MPRSLTLRQRRFVKALPHAPSLAAAARTAGYTPRHANQAAQDALASPHLQSALQQAYAKSGITDALLASHVRQQLDANKSDRADYKARTWALRLAHEVRGDLKTAPTISQPLQLQINLPARG